MRKLKCGCESYLKKGKKAIRMCKDHYDKDTQTSRAIFYGLVID